MDFDTLFAQVLEALQSEQRISYRALRRRFDLSDDDLEDLKVEIIEAKQLAIDENDRILVWVGESGEVPKPTSISPPVQDQKPAPISYTPKYLTEKILTSRSALAGERKQVTVMFADIKDSTELIRDLDPEAAQQLLDPAIHIMMDAVHRFEGTVNQVLGDGIMALFGAPISHEDHAARSCYAALAMQTAMQPYAEEVLRSDGITMQIRVGLNSGEVVVRTIGNDLGLFRCRANDASSCSHGTDCDAWQCYAEQFDLAISGRLGKSQCTRARASQGHDRTCRGLRANWSQYYPKTPPGCCGTWPDQVCRARYGNRGSQSSPRTSRSWSWSNHSRSWRSGCWKVPSGL
jgi:hypothetical protein